MPVRRSHWQRKFQNVVLDHSPLLTYFGLHYLQSTKADKATSDEFLRWLRPSGSPLTETEQERFLSSLPCFEHVLTTPHVLTEAFKIRGGSKLCRYREDLRRVGVSMLLKGGVEEVAVPVMELCAQEDFAALVYRLGLPDAGVIYLAVRQQGLLLTDDKRLYSDYPASDSFQICMLDEYLRADA